MAPSIYDSEFRCGSELRLIRLVIWYACKNSSVLSIDYARKFYCLPCMSGVLNIYIYTASAAYKIDLNNFGNLISKFSHYLFSICIAYKSIWIAFSLTLPKTNIKSYRQSIIIIRYWVTVFICNWTFQFYSPQRLLVDLLRYRIQWTYRSARELRKYVWSLPRFTYSIITKIGSFSAQQPNSRTTFTCGSSVFIT